MKIKLINLLGLFILSTQVVGCQPSEQQLRACNQNINEELGLSKPYSDWIQVLCTREGHIIKPAKGYQWVSGGKKHIYLNRTGEIQSLDKSSYYKKGIDLQISWGQVERVGYVIKNFNDLLSKLKPDAPAYKEAHSLGFRGDMPFTYDFFILTKDSQPEYMVLCKEQCHVGEPVLIEVNKTQPDA